jgi:Hsp20/alpha crystallin family
VRVEFEDGVLTVAGERKQEKEEQGKTFHKIERGYGKFVRRFALPTEVDATKLAAEFKEGVVNVHLPKSPDGKRSASKLPSELQPQVRSREVERSHQWILHFAPCHAHHPDNLGRNIRPTLPGEQDAG